jgi:D-alanyl-lipoteichoic acid acyltransferase DltB (MBOAT superfamily)
VIDPIFFLLVILLTVSLLNGFFGVRYWPRYIAAVLPGVFILSYAGMGALILAFSSCALFFGLFLISRSAGSKWVKNYLPYFGLLLLLVPDFEKAWAEGNLLFIGSAFYIIRLFVTVKESIKNSLTISDYLLSSGLATFFFASLFTGPVFNGIDIHEQLKREEPGRIGDGLFKLLEGFVFILPVSQAVVYLQGKNAILQNGIDLFLIPEILHYVGQPALAFLFVFTTFFGYSKVAEGVANLMGFEVPVNFNQPHKSKNFADFWRRWHRSMADFVMKYLYLPIAINFRNPKLGLVAAFVFMGLWHDITLGYFVWGIAHSTALIVLQPRLVAPAFPVFLARVITLTFVVYVSYLANHVLQ